MTTKDSKKAPPSQAGSKGGEIVVEAFVVESLAPSADIDADIAALLPKHGEHPTRASVIIHGINSAIANGIRRILLSEMDNLALRIDPDTWRTDDKYVMIDMIERRIALVPLTQSAVREGSRFVLDVSNDTDEPMDVMSSNLRATKSFGDRAFFETFNLVTIQPHKEIHFAADVVRNSGYDDAAFATAFTAISIPLDERPIEIARASDLSTVKPPPALPYADRARYVQSSSVSDPHVYQIIFESVGKGAPNEIFTRVIDSFIERTKAILKAPIVRGQSRQSSGSSAQSSPMSDDITDLYTIQIQGETSTIGELFSRCCVAVFPHIDLVTCDLNDLKGELIIRVRTQSEPIETVVQETIQYALRKLEAIRRAL